MNTVSYEVVDEIGVITVNNPPVNALSHAVRSGILEALRAAQTDESKAILVICDGRTFIAGADISEFGKPPQEPYLPELINEIEASTKLVVAAIHGTALGGGFEGDPRLSLQGRTRFSQSRFARSETRSVSGSRRYAESPQACGHCRLQSK